MRFKRQRGTQDVLPEQAVHWQMVERSMRRTLESYGYGEIRTPLFEDTELFVRSVGSETDIVQKEMYTFADRKGRSLTLRPEGTAAVVRAYLESHMGREGGVRRLYYYGPMYRYDRPQAGRYREFFQVGAEAIGSPEPEQDVEIIDVMMTMLRELGLEDLQVEVNSVGHPECRRAYETVLRAALERARDGFCDTCRERFQNNPLRVFDCKNKACRALAARLPVLRRHLCDDCESHHATVMTALAKLEIPHRENPHIVRGLDYYTRTAFEVHYPALGAQSALGGGGRYDGLVEACGGPPTPAVGFSGGIERVLYALEKIRPERTVAAGPATVLVLPRAEAKRVEALQLAQELRAHARTVVDLSGRSLKAQLRGADRLGARVAVIVGGDEVAPGEVVVRDLRASEQERVARAEVGAAVAERLRPHGGGA